MNSIFSAFIPSLHSSHHRCQSTEPLYSASSYSQPQDVRPFCSCLCIIHGGRRRGRGRGSRDFSDPATFVLVPSFLPFLLLSPLLSPLNFHVTAVLLSVDLSLALVGNPGNNTDGRLIPGNTAVRHSVRSVRPSARGRRRENRSGAKRKGDDLTPRQPLFLSPMYIYTSTQQSSGIIFLQSLFFLAGDRPTPAETNRCCSRLFVTRRETHPERGERCRKASPPRLMS